MMLVRAVNRQDVDALYELTKQATPGITSLPPDKEFLEKKIHRSLESFSKHITVPDNELYFFVLEDLSTGRIIGCSAIEACVGKSLPFYSFKYTLTSGFDADENIHVENPVLIPTTDFNGTSELCSLYLHEEFRTHSYGLLLSLSRFMWIALAPTRFTKTLIAEIRGVNKDGISPFWDNLGKHFFQMDFAKADNLSGHGKSIVSNLIPKFPIYIQLLHPDAQSVIGRTHPQAQRAYQILLQLGFEDNGYVDIFDAGPTVSAKVENLKIIQNCIKTHICAIQTIKRTTCLIGTLLPEPRFIIDQIDFMDNGIILSAEAANNLQKMPGDELCVYVLGN